MGAGFQGSSGLRLKSATATLTESFKAQWLLYVAPDLHTQILRSAHTQYLCVLCGSQNKQGLFPYTTLTDWFV